MSQSSVSSNRVHGIVSPSMASTLSSPLAVGDTFRFNDSVPNISPLNQTMVKPMQQIIQAVVPEVTKSVKENGVNEEINDEDFEQSIKEMEAVVKEAIDYIQDCYDSEEQLIYDLDITVTEGVQMKVTTEQEAQTFVYKLQKFSEFVQNFKGEDKF